MDNLVKIEDLPEAKARKFGPKLLAVIKQFCQNKGLKSDNFQEELDHSDADIKVNFSKLHRAKII